MAAFKPEVDELVGGQLMAVDGGLSSLDELDRRSIDEDTDSLGARDAAVATLDVLGFYDELAAEMTRQNVCTRTLY